jgi:Fe(3+) dicitrate transport protein
MYYRSFSLGLTTLISSAMIAGLTAVPAFAQEAVVTQTINVTGEPVATPHPHDDTRPKLEHIMREVSETQITVTKKATVINLDKEPPVQANNLQQLFTKAPGLVVSEQQNPGQYNYSYRGLGNPQESEYTLFLQDGLPLMAEWIGFPRRSITSRCRKASARFSLSAAAAVSSTDPSRRRPSTL